MLNDEDWDVLAEAITNILVAVVKTVKAAYDSD